MAITGTSTDYVGRTVDMYISGSLNPLSSATQSVNYSFGNPSQFIAGVQKLVQRYIISLTNSGFVERLTGASNNNISYASTLFIAYNWAIVQEFRQYQVDNPSPNPDELLNTVQLLGISQPTNDSINFSLQLITNTGDSVLFTVPLPL